MASVGMVALPTAGAAAAVIEFTYRSAWEDAVGEFTTIDFTAFPEGTFITDQYAAVGLLFADGNDSINFTPSFVNDGWGLDGNGDIRLSFVSPQAYIGVDFPGALHMELYSQGRLIYSSSVFGVGGVGFFGGLLSTELFDEARLLCPFELEAEIDDLHFGVPAPGALWLIALGGFYNASSRARGRTTRFSSKA